MVKITIEWSEGTENDVYYVRYPIARTIKTLLTEQGYTQYNMRKWSRNKLNENHNNT